jgi:hypothetical protein
LSWGALFLCKGNSGPWIKSLEVTALGQAIRGVNSGKADGGVVTPWQRIRIITRTRTAAGVDSWGDVERAFGGRFSRCCSAEFEGRKTVHTIPGLKDKYQEDWLPLV